MSQNEGKDEKEIVVTCMIDGRVENVKNEKKNASTKKTFSLFLNFIQQAGPPFNHPCIIHCALLFTLSLFFACECKCAEICRPVVEIRPNNIIANLFKQCTNMLT